MDPSTLHMSIDEIMRNIDADERRCEAGQEDANDLAPKYARLIKDQLRKGHIRLPDIEQRISALIVQDIRYTRILFYQALLRALRAPVETAAKADAAALVDIVSALHDRVAALESRLPPSAR